MTTPTRDEAVRQQFEAWAVEHGLPIERDSAGSYTDDEAQTAWSAVQYVHALRSPAVAGLVEALKEARRVIELDRKALFECHRDPKADAVIDAPGLEGLREYDAALAGLDAALAPFATLAGESQ